MIDSLYRQTHEIYRIRTRGLLPGPGMWCKITGCDAPLCTVMGLTRIWTKDPWFKLDLCSQSQFFSSEYMPRERLKLKFYGPLLVSSWMVNIFRPHVIGEKMVNCQIHQNNEKNLKLLQSCLKYCKIAINHNKYRKIAMHYWNKSQTAKSKIKLCQSLETNLMI